MTCQKVINFQGPSQYQPASAPPQLSKQSSVQSGSKTHVCPSAHNSVRPPTDGACSRMQRCPRPPEPSSRSSGLESRSNSAPSFVAGSAMGASAEWSMSQSSSRPASVTRPSTVALAGHQAAPLTAATARLDWTVCLLAASAPPPAHPHTTTLGCVLQNWEF
jgi:hypothetical protein